MLTRMMILSLVLAIMLAPSLAFAEASPWTETDDYGDKAIEKLDYGMKNVLAGWTELFTEPYDAYKADENVMKGTGIGLYHGVAHTIGGAFHTLTFPIPIDLPLPDGGVSIE